MARYKDDSRERVRDSVDFVQLVGARTELRKAGVRRYVGLCPFHDERTPSFGIDPVEKLYHCFGCGEGGDVFRFVMETESMTFAEALEALADRFGIELEREEEDPRAAERRERRDRLLALLERTAAYYVRMLWGGEEAAGARAYLAARGLDEGFLREFRVGYSPSAWDRVLVGSQKAGFSVAELLASGLAQRGDRGAYDRFRGRLMFPLADARGRVEGFGARALRDNQQPKYLNSSDSDVFSKGRRLFATHLARPEAAKAGAVILAEGYTDVIALHQAGMRNAVGLMGTALTEAQAGELMKLAGTVLLCLDADAAGQKAMTRASEVAGHALGELDHFAKRVDLRVVSLPAGKDPADVVRESGVEAMRSLLAAAVPFARFRVERALEGAATSGDAADRDAALAESAAVIRGIPPSVLREELVQLVAGRLAMSEQLVAATLTEAPGRGSNGATRPDTGGATTTRTLDRRTEAEHAYLALCVALPDEGAQRLAAADLDALFAAPLTRRAAALVRDHAAAPSAAIAGEDDELRSIVAELVVRAGAVDAPAPALLDRAALHLDLARLERDIANARVDGTPLGELAAQRQRVLADLRKLVT